MADAAAPKEAGRLEKEVALLRDKLANAEDEYAALYAKALKNDAKEQERVARHHKAVSQLQKKILAEAEARRQLQRKLDNKDAPLTAVLSEKETAWKVERERLSAQMLSLEENRTQLQEELARSRTQLHQCEASLQNWGVDKQAMNANLQELEASVAHWKNTAEKRKALAADAVAAQRSSDSRVIVLDAELKRLRNEHNDLLQRQRKIDVNTQTEGNSEQESLHLLAQKLAWEVVRDVAMAATSLGDIGQSLQDEALKATQPAVLTSDAHVSTDPVLVSEVAVTTDPAPSAKCAEVQTQPVDLRTRAEACVQTTKEVRAMRFHVDTQTDLPDDLMRAPSDAGTPASSSSQDDHLDYSAHSDSGDSEASKSTPQALRTWSKHESPVIKKDVDRDERWWRRSALKATDGSPTPSSPATPILPLDGARALPLKMDVSSLDKLDLSGPASMHSVVVGPVSPTAMGSGTPHPKPAGRRHFANGSPCTSMRSLLPAAAAAQLKLPPNLHGAQPVASPATLTGSMREGALNRPHFRASEPPLQVRLPLSPMPSPLAVLHRQVEAAKAAGAEEAAGVNKHETLRAAALDEATAEACSPDLPAGSSPSSDVAPQAAHAGNLAGPLLASQDASGQGQSLGRTEPESASLCAHEADMTENFKDAGAALPVHADASSWYVPAAVLGADSLSDMKARSSAQKVESPAAEPPRADAARVVEDNVEVEKCHDAHERKEQARVQSNIAEHHSIEAALLSGRTDRVVLAQQKNDAGAALAGDRPHDSTGSTAHHASTSAVLSATAGAVSGALAGASKDEESAILATARQDLSEHTTAVLRSKDQRQSTGPLEHARALGAPFVSHTQHLHIRLIAEHCPGDVILPNTTQKGVETPEGDGPSSHRTFPGGEDNEQGDGDAQDSNGQSKPALNPKFSFGSPRDAVSLLTDSPQFSQEVRNAGERVLKGENMAVKCLDSDSSDDDTWNGFVASGVRPRLDRSLLDEAAGLNKTLSKSLSRSFALPSQGPHHIGPGPSTSRNARLESRRHDWTSDGISGWPQKRMPRTSLALPHSNHRADEVNGLDSPKDTDAQYDLGGLLDEVRRATDRCERRKRMAHMLHNSADHQHAVEKDKIVDELDEPLRRLESHKEPVRPHRRTGLLSRRFGTDGHRERTGSHAPAPTPEFAGVGYTRQRSPEQLSMRAPKLALAGHVPISPERNELLQMILGPEESDSAIRWSPIRPSQMAVLRSFLTKLES